MTIHENNETNERNIDFIQKIYKLPEDIITVIKEFVPKKYFVFTNMENYHLYHSFIRKDVCKYENYIRDMIRHDNHFVFDKIMNENYKKWFELKNYRYKNMIFKCYAYFVIHYCIENDSNKCRNRLDIFFKELGLCKNLHKKNIIKYVKWNT
jgi:hypothetical protein